MLFCGILRTCTHHINAKDVFSISKIFINHLWALGFRVVLLGIAISLYFYNPNMLNFTAMPRGLANDAFLLLCWITLVTSMMFRLFPNKRVPMGARKHYSTGKNLISDDVSLKPIHKKAGHVALVWVVFSALMFFIMHLLGVLTPTFAILVVLFYAVCDVVFILFFCPFQKWFMRNHCCTNCRIYNWDFIMMMTPLIIFPSVYSATFIAAAIAVLIRWEFSIAKSPHLFSVKTNKNLSCINCEDKLCYVKRKMR